MKNWERISTAAALLLLLCLFSLSIGETGFYSSPKAFIDNYFIVQEIRFPRMLSAALVGASLGLSGLLTQTSFRNELAEPFTVGLAGSASLGIGLGILLGLDDTAYALSSISFIFTLLSGLGLVVFKKIFLHRDSKQFILLGIVLSLFCSSLVSVVISKFRPDQMQTLYYWLLGGFGSYRDQWWPIIALTIGICLLVSMNRSKKLDLFLIDRSSMPSFSILENRELAIQLFLVSLLTGVSVAACGMIGFIGLMAPHLAARMLSSYRHKALIPMSALMGAGLVQFADILAKTFSSGSYTPTGAVCTLFGTPFFLYLLARRRSNV
ncbi:MAG: FecCD family ABC transporter permease [Bdellovibrionales bacterium]